METMTLKAEPRTRIGKKGARSTRERGLLPAIIYGHGEAPEAVSLSFHDVGVALHHGARTLTVDVNGTAKRYLIKAVQYDHFGTTPVHIDLARVDIHERVRLRVGIELRGVPKGVADGGVLEQYMGDIEVECLVTDIPGTLHPLVTHLGVGDSLLVKDLVLPPGVTVRAQPEDRVASCRELMEAPAVVPAVITEGEQPAEPERIGRVRKEEEPEEKK